MVVFQGVQAQTLRWSLKHRPHWLIPRKLLQFRSLLDLQKWKGSGGYDGLATEPAACGGWATAARLAPAAPSSLLHCSRLVLCLHCPRALLNHLSGFLLLKRKKKKNVLRIYLKIFINSNWKNLILHSLLSISNPLDYTMGWRSTQRTQGK